MQATRAWWAQFETDPPQFVLTTSVPLPVPDPVEGNYAEMRDEVQP